jgi:cold shock CspA family protein
MQYAVVQKFSALRGFGFLIQGFRTRFFFHITEWQSDLEPKQGMSVCFETAPANKPGMPDQAVRVRPTCEVQS